MDTSLLSLPLGALWGHLDADSKRSLRQCSKQLRSVLDANTRSLEAPKNLDVDDERRHLVGLCSRLPALSTIRLRRMEAVCMLFKGALGDAPPSCCPHLSNLDLFFG